MSALSSKALNKRFLTFALVKDGTMVVLHEPDELDTFYRLIECSTIDIVTRKISGEYFDIVCDDEGLLVNKPVRGVSMDGREVLVGNLIICGHSLPDDEGNLRSLTVKDLLRIQRAINPLTGLLFYEF